jgi:murein hydrolase activator
MRQHLMAGAASAVAVVLFFLSTADATQPTLREVERRRANAELDRKRLEAEALAAKGDAQKLSRTLKDAAARREAAALAAQGLEREAAGLVRTEITADAEAARTRAAYERTLVALTRPADRRPHAMVVAAVAGRSLAERNRVAVATAGEARTRRRDLAARRAELAVSEAQLESEKVALRTALAEQEARQALLNAERSRAESQLAQLARQARSLRDLAARVAPGRANVGRRTAASPPPALSSAAMGRLTATPASVVRRYGERVPGGSAQGITLRTRTGAEVLAPSAGKVAWSGPFRSYGIVLILDLDNDYAVVLTGMDTVSATVGQRVRAGQPIAVMGADTTSAPELYVEVRQDGRPVDPARWLGGGGS